MEALTPFLPLIVIVGAIIIIVRWRKSVRYLRQGGTDDLKAHGIEPVKPSGKSQKKPKSASKPSNTERTLYSGVELTSLNKRLAEELENESYVLLEIDEDSLLADSGAIRVMAEGERIGNLPRDVAKEIRGSDVAQLEAEVNEIWIGDYGGAKVLVELIGTREDLINKHRFEISLRKEKKTSKPGQFQGYDTHDYQPDLALFKELEDWESYENLLKDLIDADAQNPDFTPGFNVLELARLYRNSKRYEEERNMLSQYETAITKHDRSMPGKLASRLRRSTQLAAKAGSKA